MRLWLCALLAVGCVERRDPDACHADTDCTDGTVCSALSECDTPQDLHAATVNWTIDGEVASSLTCTRAIGFLVGFTDSLGDGFSIPATCTDGTSHVERIPRSYATAQISAYGGTDQLIGTASMPLSALDDATVELDVDLH